MIEDTSQDANGTSDMTSSGAPPFVHGAVWTPSAISRFWDYVGKRGDKHDEYFSRQVGAGIVRLASKMGVIKGTVLDYGCGAGFLAECLLPTGVSVHGADVSHVAVKNVNARFDGRSGWCGALRMNSVATPFQDDRFDLVFCIEVLEHLPDEAVSPVIKELHRLCRPGGTVFVSTPNRENLQRGLIYCPFCRTEFHEMQHIRSFTDESLGSLLAAHGFDVRFAAGINFALLQFPHLRMLRRVLVRHVLLLPAYAICLALATFTCGPFFLRMLPRFLGKHACHLCAVATKPTVSDEP